MKSYKDERSTSKEVSLEYLNSCSKKVLADTICTMLKHQKELISKNNQVKETSSVKERAVN